MLTPPSNLYYARSHLFIRELIVQEKSPVSRGESSKESELSIQSGVSFGEQLMEQYVKKDRQKSRITL